LEERPEGIADGEALGLGLVFGALGADGLGSGEGVVPPKASIKQSAQEPHRADTVGR